MSKIACALLGAVLIVSCGYGEPNPPEGLPFVSEDALGGLSETDRALVELEATWMCDAMRQSSSQPGIVDEIRMQTLEDNGVSERQYLAFRESLEERIDVREAVLVRFVELCVSAQAGRTAQQEVTPGP